MKLIAINEIEYQEKNGGSKTAAPGSLFTIDDKTGAMLKKAKAARDPNEGETALETLREQKAGSAKKNTSSSRSGNRQGRKVKNEKPDGGGAGNEDSGRDDDVV